MLGLPFNINLFNIVTAGRVQIPGINFCTNALGRVNWALNDDLNK